MSDLRDALFELRVAVLRRIAEKKNLRAESSTIAELARAASDSAVMAELHRRNQRFWLWSWFRRDA